MARLKIGYGLVREGLLVGKRFSSPVILKALPYLLGLAILLGGMLSALSYFAGDWWRDVLLNLGFLLSTAAFTILIVNRLVSLHEQARWSGPREVAWLQLRVIAAGMVQSIAQYYPDPELTLNSPSYLNRTQMYADLDAPYRSFYSDPKWVRHIQDDVIPAFEQDFPDFALYQLKGIARSLSKAETDLTECLALFSQLLDANTIEQALRLIGLIRREFPYVQVVWNEKSSGGGVSNNPRPALSSLLEMAIRIVITVNYYYPASPKIS